MSIQPDSPDSSHGLKLSSAHRVQLIRAQSLCLQQQNGSPHTDRLVQPSSTHTVLADKTLPAKTQMWSWSCIHVHTQTRVWMQACSEHDTCVCGCMSVEEAGAGERGGGECENEKYICIFYVFILCLLLF